MSQPSIEKLVFPSSYASDPLAKSYANDWAKSKSRDLVRDMIANTLLTYRKPQDLRVLCFPGLDAQEIFEVYDGLGIPRGNIVGVERDPRIAAEIEAKKLGIRVETTTIEDYFAREKTLGFDIISLDYTGPMSDNQWLGLQSLADKSTVTAIVLHVANSMRRERSLDYLLANAMAYTDPSLYESGKNGPGLKSLSDNLFNELEAIPNLPDDEKMLRRQTAYRSFVSGLLHSITILDIKKVLDFFQPGLSENILLDYKSSFNLEFSDEELLFSPVTGPLLHYSFIAEGCIRLKNRLISRNPFGNRPDDNLVHNMFGLLVESTSPKNYRLTNRTGYTYISESGTPMIGEIAYAKRDVVELNLNRIFADSFNFPNQFHFKTSLEQLGRNYLASLRRSKQQKENAPKYASNLDAPNLFVGNSARSIITKSRAIKAFREGASVDDVQAKFRGWSNKPLAQWKAHVSMGTYDSKPVVDQPAEELDVEKISREEAYDLLDSGIPPKEVFRAYPTSFTRHQLRAFKAHITMKREKESKNEEVA